ncbi:MAG: hypothetical protein EKK51_02925 [Mycolicibacterium sp.]|uniref:hypothetical protein n=2 Tax=Bacteria TaxID=2 RepID=UPI000FBC70E2|nr:hypothetical protein [Mycolicibacterium sp.]RUP34187.1 MAG: hypothetical protein EKK51_02925 [Mycolicibacterium sp.]
MGTQTDKTDNKNIQQARRQSRLVGAVAAGVVTTLTALTVGAAPVSAKPSSDSDSSSTTTLVPKPPRQDSSSAQDGSGSSGGYGQDGGGQRGRKQREQPVEAEAPSRPAPADVPPVQAKPPADPPAAPVTPEAPVIAAPETKAPENKVPDNKVPESKAPEKTPQAPVTTTQPVETPVVAAPPSHTDAPAPTTKVTKAQEAPADPTTPARPSTAVAEPDKSAPSATSTTQGPTTALAERPAPAGAVDPDKSTAPTDRTVAEGKPVAGLEGQFGERVEAGPGRAEASASASATVTAGSSKSASPSTSRAVRPIELLKPETVTAPAEDIATAKAAAAVDVKLPEPAPVHDVADLAKVVNVANFQFDTRADWDRRDNRPDWDRHDNRPMGRDWDNRVRQWRPDWVQYDDYYRPVLFNPYRDPVRVVYVYRNAPRIVYIPPLQRIVMEVADLAAYSFTAVVVNAVNTAVNVAVGSFFGGGYYPGVGVPLPPPPPPVLSYANVPVQVRYSDAVYQPFRVQRIVDAGDDVQYGERRVLLDGVTPAWGQWTQSPSGERQFEVHRTQQFPGLDEPREAPLPGDYNLQLVNDQKGLENPNKALTIAAVTCGVLSLGAIGLSVYIGRRRREVV